MNSLSRTALRVAIGAALCAGNIMAPNALAGELPIASSLQITFEDASIKEAKGIYQWPMSAVFSFQTQYETSATILYGATKELLTQMKTDGEKRTSHRIALQDLGPFSTYYYQIVAPNIEGGKTRMPAGHFSTPAADKPYDEEFIKELDSGKEASGYKNFTLQLEKIPVLVEEGLPLYRTPQEAIANVTIIPSAYGAVVAWETERADGIGGAGMRYGLPSAQLTGFGYEELAACKDFSGCSQEDRRHRKAVLRGLAPSTAYVVRFQSSAKEESKALSFMTTESGRVGEKTLLASELSSPRFQSFTITSGASETHISVETKTPTKLKVEYGTSYLQLQNKGIIEDANLATSHDLVIKGQRPNTVYAYTLSITDALGGEHRFPRLSRSTETNPGETNSITYRAPQPATAELPQPTTLSVPSVQAPQLVEDKGLSQKPLPKIKVAMRMVQGKKGTSVITWSAPYAQKCIASGDWSGKKKSQGSFTTSRKTKQTFVLTCTAKGYAKGVGRVEKKNQKQR